MLGFSPMVGSPLVSTGEAVIAGEARATGTLSGSSSLSGDARATASGAGTMSGEGSIDGVASNNPVGVMTGTSSMVGAGRTLVAGAGTMAGSSNLIGDNPIPLFDPAAFVHAGTGAGAYVPPDKLLEKIAKKRERRKPLVHVMKVGVWPDETHVLPVAAQEDYADINDVVAGMHIEEADTDDDEAMAMIMALAA